MIKGARYPRLLAADVALVQSLLDEFEIPGNGEDRIAQLTPTGQLLAITNLPLPDGFDPDYVDALVDVSRYPDPPIGVYVLNDGFNGQQQELRRRFNLFRDAAYHDADAIPGYTWICHVYPDNRWQLKPDDLTRGDNLRKYLSLFLSKLEN
jgi:hypothetical protein